VNSFYVQYRNLLTAEANRLIARHTSGRPPFDPYAIADVLKVEVREALLDGAEGYVLREGGKWCAIISARSAKTRRRFTLAHELGHVLLFRARENGHAEHFLRYRSPSFQPNLHQDPDEEALCNAFAQELLMPFDEFQNRVNIRTVSPAAILNIAREFDVSVQAAALKSLIILGRRRVGYSLWDLKALWPVKVWWNGAKTRIREELTRLQRLAAVTIAKTEIWHSYNRRRCKTLVQVAPLPKSQYSLIVTVPADSRAQEPHQHGDQLALFNSSSQAP
jgi:Zn-dependent peptidase ImmA (M78 family)